MWPAIGGRRVGIAPLATAGSEIALHSCMKSTAGRGWSCREMHLNWILTAATWAVALFYRSCQFLMFRDIPAEIIDETLRTPCPRPMGPAVVYSVDLIFQHLPRLLALARGLAPADPLVLGLRRIAKEWPFSSVGDQDGGPGIGGQLRWRRLVAAGIRGPDTGTSRCLEGG